MKHGGVVMYTALAVADYIIRKCNAERESISNLKLQKLLYFVQAEFLVNTPENRACFSDEIEAWDFGPVVPAVYHEYKFFGNGSIPANHERADGRSQEITEKDRKMIDAVLDQTAGYSASYLVEITHRQAPWRNAYRRGRNSIISKASILEYFK